MITNITKLQQAKEDLDNALYYYIKQSGVDPDTVDYSSIDKWLEQITGTANPLEDEGGINNGTV